jgi:hypothetical protein
LYVERFRLFSARIKKRVPLRCSKVLINYISFSNKWLFNVNIKHSCHALRSMEYPDNSKDVSLNMRTEKSSSIGGIPEEIGTI